MTSEEQFAWFITGYARSPWHAARRLTFLPPSASPGIGLEMTRQLLQSSSNTVIAACRTPSKAVALKDLQKEAKGKLHVVKIDIDNPESIRACADETTQALGNKGIDYIVNNAAVKSNLVSFLPLP